ncbi:MAG: hypothetical protein C0179_06520 [Fervidicoccus sp.]|nr:MAG: hypothetical protein C0179_06520 [Fervidicoccus sp.]
MKSSILLKLRTPEFTLLKKARDLYFKKLKKRSTELLKQNVNPSLIAKITHYTKLDCILTYKREKEAERILNKTSKNDTKNRESG